MKCKPCDGTGKVTCSECKGEGIRVASLKCAPCEGAGLIPCAACEGNGKVSFFQWLKSG